jgi:hypothetical protein
MHRLSWIAVVVLLVFWPLPSRACGDKLLMLGRGLRFSALAPERPVAMLAFAPEGSLLATVLQDPQWIAAMNKGKHRLDTVQTSEQLRAALGRRRYELILLNLSDEAQLRPVLHSFAVMGLPVVSGSARDQAQAAQREYGVVLKSESRSKDFLSAISKAVELRDRHAQELAQARKSRKAF